MFNQRTIYDELTAKGVSWRVYFHDFPQVLALANMRKPQSRPHIVPIDQWEEDLREATGTFPAFSFIEPAYFDLNGPANDDHPPHDTQETQTLIARIYNSLRQSSVWERSLLVITYDEHGGFYDHVNPDQVIPPDDLQEEYSFNQLGVRVPALLVSPYASQRVYSETLDHTSIGAYLVERFGISPLGARMAGARSFSDALTVRPDNAGPTAISSTTGRLACGIDLHSPTRDTERQVQNENQMALDVLSKALVQDKALGTVYGEDRRSNVEAMSIVADDPRQRALRFLRSTEP